MALNSWGVQAAGRAAADAAAGVPGRASIGGLTSNSWDVNTKGLDDLSSKIKQIVSDVKNLDTAIKNLTDKLTGLATAAGKAFGGKSTGGAALSVSTFSGTAAAGTTLNVAGFANPPSGQGAGGAFGGGQQGIGGAVASAALMEVAAQAAGKINTSMGTAATGAMGTDIMARQTNAIFGGQGARNTVAGFNTMSNMGPQDLQQALATMQSNPRLYAGNGTAKQKALTSFVNQLQKMNPGMSAAQAMQTANALASGPVLSSMQRYGALTQALPNYKTGGINSTNTVFSGLMKTLEGGRNLTPAQLKAMSGNSNYATQQWSLITQNNAGPMGMGLSNTMLTDLRAWAAGGGSAKGLEQSMNKSYAAKLLATQTAGTRNKDTQFESAQSTMNWLTTLHKDFLGWETTMNRNFPLIASAGTLFSKGAELFFAGVAALEGTKIVGRAVRDIKGIHTEGTGLLGWGKAFLKHFTGGGSNNASGAPTGTGSLSNTIYGTNGTGTALTVELKGVDIKDGCLQVTGCQEGGTPHKATTRKKSKKSSGGGGGGGMDWNIFGDAVRVAKHTWGTLNAGPPKLPKKVNDIGRDVTEGLLDFFGDPVDGMGDPPTGSTTTRGMQPSLAKRINAMRAANPNLKISSGHRTSQQQATLYAMKGGKGVAQPGQSKHQSGQAADLGPSSQFSWIAKNASKFGLKRPAPRSEPWHVEMGDPVTAAQVVSGAASFLGTPYVWGGGNASGVTKGQPGDSADPNAPNQVGLDCSGLVVAVFGKLGINLPRTSQEQASAGKAVASLASAQAGDLLFYSYGSKNDHVAIYIGGGRQIAAPQTGQVVQVQSIDKKHLSAIRRILNGSQTAKLIQTAQSYVGTPSSDSHSVVMGGTGVGLTNTFIQMVNAGGVGVGGMGGGGGTGSGSTVLGGSGVTTTSTNSTSGALTGTLSWTGTDTSITSPTQFSAALMRKLGLSTTNQDAQNINAWQQNEGQWGAKGNYNAMIMHNPLNARLNSMPGAVPLTGTTAYPSWAEGVQATAQMIQQGNMKPILTALKANDNLASFTKALESTPWASSAYGGRSFSPPSGIYAMGDPETGGMAMPSGSGGGVATISAMTKGRAGIYIGTLNIPITLAGSATQQDAQNIAQMVMQEIQKQSGLSSVSGS